jgi:UDPglucose 6-dehydrogenase
MKNAKMLLPGAVEFCNDPYAAVEGADAVIMLTEWNEFKQVDFARVVETMNQPFMFDGRNLYNPADMAKFGFKYESVGRPESAANPFNRLMGVQAGN